MNLYNVQIDRQGCSFFGEVGSSSLYDAVDLFRVFIYVNSLEYRIDYDEFGEQRETVNGSRIGVYDNEEIVYCHCRTENKLVSMK